MTERQYGIAGTVILHSILLLILIFTYISLSKPAPSEGGLLINFGDVESAYGPAEPAMNNQQQTQAAAASKVLPSDADDGMLTQDFEEAPVVKKPAVKKTETKKTEVKPVAKTVQTTASPEPKAPVVNKRALYSNKTSAGKSTTESGSSEGIYKGSGNMGNPTGSTESDDYTKGVGGSGGGIGFDLGGRNPVHLPKPAFTVLKDGIVVVEITVDQSGKVISATPGVKGSTLVDNTLYAAAKKAALESKFNVKNDAQERQIGTITYHFKLQ